MIPVGLKRFAQIQRPDRRHNASRKNDSRQTIDDVLVHLARTLCTKQSKVKSQDSKFWPGDTEKVVKGYREQEFPVRDGCGWRDDLEHGEVTANTCIFHETCTWLDPDGQPRCQVHTDSDSG